MTRRGLIGTRDHSESRLPKEYREVEFIESSKQQYFWSDVLIQDGLTVDSVQSFNIGDSFLFGGYADATGRNRSAFNGTYGGKVQGAYPATYYLIGNGSLLERNRAVYHVVTTHAGGERTVYLDDALIGHESNLGTVTQTGAPCCAFAYRQSTAVGDDVANLQYAYSGRVYSLKVSKGNDLLANYVPCYRKSDGKAGMYDLVLGKYYTSETATDFVAGPKV